VRGYIANTDFDWYEFLKARSPLEEVNFWLPSGRNMLRIGAGTPFFFKLKKPHYAIGGFGIVARAEILPAWLAWDSFGIGNGAADFPTMRRRIEKYRESNEVDLAGDYAIGCVMISSPTFFDRESWIPQPVDWKANNVRGEYYDLGSGEGRRILSECLARTTGTEVASPAALLKEPVPRYGTPVLVAPRLGQGTFRIAVTDAYGRACAVTGEHSLPALEAAHIRPYAENGPHEISNGLLLRSDLHRLFDKGYLTVTPDFRFEVSARLKKDFSNGRSYYPLHGSGISLPTDVTLRPASTFLSYHNNEKFLG
jgi:putative restriction endonuclease